MPRSACADTAQDGALRPEPHLKGDGLDGHGSLRAEQRGVMTTSGVGGGPWSSGSVTTEAALKATTTAFLLALETPATGKVLLLGETHTAALPRR